MSTGKRYRQAQAALRFNDPIAIIAPPTRRNPQGHCHFRRSRRDL